MHAKSLSGSFFPQISLQEPSSPSLIVTPLLMRGDFLHPTSRQYSCFPPYTTPFQKQTFFWKILSTTESSSYESITISDHAPLFMGLHFHEKPTGCRPWRFNSFLLSDESYAQIFTSQIKDFLEINTTTGTSPCTIWETLKAYIHGQIISHTSHIARQRRSNSLKLSSDILELDKNFSETTDPELYKQRLVLQTEFNLLSTNQAVQLLVN